VRSGGGLLLEHQQECVGSKDPPKDTSKQRLGCKGLTRKEEKDPLGVDLRDRTQNRRIDSDLFLLGSPHLRDRATPPKG